MTKIDKYDFEKNIKEQQDIHDIEKKLKEKGANRPCHRCGKKSFTIIPGFSKQIINEELTEHLDFGGMSIPVFTVICNNCGAITQHAIGAFGMIPDDEVQK